MENNLKIKACICGNHKSIESNSFEDRYFIKCVECNLFSTPRFSQKEAVTVWNNLIDHKQRKIYKAKEKMRKKFASMAMQGILSNAPAFQGLIEYGEGNAFEKVAFVAVAHADALIEELEKN